VSIQSISGSTISYTVSGREFLLGRCTSPVVDGYVLCLHLHFAVLDQVWSNMEVDQQIS
jgi:hypothetical protein